MSFVMPLVNSHGLGDNLLSISKAILIAKTLGYRYIPPFWPKSPHVPNCKNGYGYYFPVHRTIDHYICLAASRNLVFQNLLPVFQFTGREYWKTGMEDIGFASQIVMGTKKLKNNLLITVDGTWGKYFAIRRARLMLKSLLLSHEPSKQEYQKIMTQTNGTFKVAVHIRLGDFQKRGIQEEIQPGERFKRLPISWYCNLCDSIQKTVDCTFFLITNGESDEVDEFVTRFLPRNNYRLIRRDLVDLLLLSSADLVICSNSQFSRVGVFLNDSPYIWPADTLYKKHSGKFGYLYRSKRDPIKDGNTKVDRSLVRRCFAIRNNFESLPKGLTNYLSSKGTANIEINNDLLYKSPVAVL